MASSQGEEKLFRSSSPGRPEDVPEDGNRNTPLKYPINQEGPQLSFQESSSEDSEEEDSSRLEHIFKSSSEDSSEDSEEEIEGKIRKMVGMEKHRRQREPEIPLIEKLRREAQEMVKHRRPSKEMRRLMEEDIRKMQEMQEMLEPSKDDEWVASGSGYGMRPQQPNVARGSITLGTPVREMDRRMMKDQGVPRGQYEMRMMGQMRGVPQMYDPRMIPDQLQWMHHPAYQELQYQYNTAQPPTRNEMRRPPSPPEKEVRDPRDQAINPRAQYHQVGPSGAQKGYQIDPRTGYPVANYLQPGQQPPSSSRYSSLPDSSGAHHTPRIEPPEAYLQMPSQTGDHRKSPAMHPEYARQQYEQRERERHDKEMKDREQQIAFKAARNQDILQQDTRHVPDEFESNPYYLKLYTEAISKGEEKDSTIRVNVVGNYAQGKTSVTKRLVQETIAGTESTNSVEIKHCKYDYIQGNLYFSTSEHLVNEDQILERIAFVANSERIKDGQDERKHSHDNVTEERKRKQRFEIETEETNDVDRIGDRGLGSKRIKLEHNPVEKSTKIDFNKDSVEIETRETNEMVRLGDQSLGISSISQLEQKKFAILLQNSQKEDVTCRDLEIWDFGGQFSFYATHNLFHSRRAVYLLVFDLTKPLSSIVKDSEFPDRDEEKTMEQYAKFWINSIHTYVGSENGKEPPVILVGTHKDKLEGDEHAKEEYIEEYFEQIRKLFENTNMIRHIQPKDFSVDNTNPNDNGIVELRKEVIQQGTKLAEKSIPAKWIPLEKEVRKHMHRKIISFKELMDMDAGNEFPLQEEEQVKLFLRYHHSKGTLLYYDEEPISAYVVLDTQYLINAFKCIVTSTRFSRKNHDVRNLWNVLTTEARLENELIDKLWSSDTENDFLKHKRELVMFLEKHLIISEALIYCEESHKLLGLGWYIVPSLLRSNSTENVLTEFLTGRRRTSVRYVMSFNQSPLVQVLFYRLLAALIGRWSVVRISTPRKKALIYENLGVFRLDVYHAGIVEYKYNDIELRVLSLRPLLNVDSECADKFRRFSESIVENEFMKFRPSRTQEEKPYVICFKCNNESHGSSGGTNKLSLEHIRGGRLEPCPDTLSHDLDAKLILSEWFLEDKIKVLFPERQFNDKELSHVALAIGQNWELLGLELGLERPQIKRIDMDEHTSEMKIFTMLLQWKDEKEDEATINALIRAMKTVVPDSVNWDKIRNIIDKKNSEGIEN